ncbi:MAG: Adaptive-response sensory-kinase SasA [Syntrophus sp. SKADARSKE-3]|nr:Adaptive-response sensory-kinase SasA [Syntrophus sp. SKADARSKE-3]
MRLRTQFVITMLLFTVVLAIIAASAIITNQWVAKVREQDRIAVDIARGASELGYLSNEYLIYHEGQQLRRWQDKLALFAKQVSSLNVDKPEQQQLVANIKTNHNRMKEVFASVIASQESRSRKQNEIIDPEYLRVSWSRMAVQTQGLMSDALHLSHLLDQQESRLKQAREFLLYSLVALFGLFIFTNYMLTYRRILKSIAALRAGTAVIGAGNLDFAISETEDNEIGDLYQDFNRMTTDLKTITASKTDLEREITERKRVAEELERQRKWLSVTLASIGDAVIATDTSGRITFINPIAQSLTGWHDEEALGQPIQGVFRIINEASGKPGEDMVARVLSEKAIVAMANYTALISREGRLIPIEDSAAPIKKSDGSVIGVVIVFHDVTEKRKTQDELQRSEAMLRTVLEQMPSGVTVRDAITGTLILSNTHSKEILGQLVGTPGQFAEYRGCYPDGRPYKSEDWPLSRSIATGEIVYAEEIWCERNDGTNIIISVNSAPVRDSQGQIVIGVSIFQDITERKLAEDRLAQQAAQLQERSAQLEEINKELESFSYSVSHDLRAPLRAIDGFSRMILKHKGANFDEDTLRKFNTIRSNAQQMGQLIDDLLNLSRLGKQEMARAKLNMVDLANEVWNELQVINPDGIMELTVGDMPYAYGDRTLLKQVYINLLGNAVKFTKRSVVPTINVGGYSTGPENVYYVKDNGAGFDMAHYDKLFCVFQRLHSTDNYEGTGIGLAIVQRIVHRHGGRVWAEGEVGKGATFYLTLPGE